MNYITIEYNLTSKSEIVRKKSQLIDERFFYEIDQLLFQSNKGLKNTILEYAREKRMHVLNNLTIIFNNYSYIILLTIFPIDSETIALTIKLPESLEKELKKKTKYPSVLNSNVEYLSLVADHIDDVIWLRNDLEVLFVNKAFKKVWGREPEIVFDNPSELLEWVHPDDKSNFEPWVNPNQLNPNKPYEEQYRIIKPDGSIRWLWSRMIPIYNNKKQPYQIVGVASDITELKDFETALKVAKEKAQETDRLKSSFLANISHEIRTPMNGIVGFAELLTKVELDQETKDSYLDIIKKSSIQLIQIIDDIIDLSKIESNQFELNIQAFNVNKVIRDLSVYYNQYIKNSGHLPIILTSEPELNDDDVDILSDENRLKQILSNLLDNAIKYTPEGNVTFGYKLKESVLEFYVKDTGIGIPKEKQDIIFEHFRQADEGRTRKYGGTGMGLSICKGLINMLSGEIWFESEESKGSNFYFTLPYTQSKKTSKPYVKKKLESVYDWSNKLILIAEDDKLNYEFLYAVLKPTKATLVKAENGSQAIKMCDNLNFHIILMDIRLPIINGLEATRRIRDKGITTPIIAQTAYAYEDDRNKCLMAGCNDYITKPLRKDLLLKMIDKHLHENE